MVAAKYGISGELGEITTRTHRVVSGGKTAHNTASDFFEATVSRERFKSCNFMELMLDSARDTSVRVATSRLNRIRRETVGIKETTYRNTIEREGLAMQKSMEQKCESALEAGGFVCNDGVYENPDFKPIKARCRQQSVIEKAAKKLNIKNYNPDDYELPCDTVNISVDDVGVKRQSEMRPKDEDSQQPKRVENTIIHVGHRKDSYIINADSVLLAFKQLIGFLLINGLLRKRIVVFVDGARSLNSAILKMLSFTNYKVILDWYHLQKKCREQLSMALKGSKIRNEFLDKELLPCLWFGNVNGAIKSLKNIDPKKVKNQEYITKLIEYFERVRGIIPNYALRKELKLRNSSGIGEKSNDLVVSNRQKHNGMSWSDSGSFAFATVAAASCNGEIMQWIFKRDIDFCLQKVA